MRLFVALSLPERVQDQLAMLCEGLPGARWVPPENFHITLRFVGEVDGGVMQDLDASLAGIRAPRFSLSLSGVGHFGGAKGGRNGARALWVGVAKEPALQHLHDKVESAVVRAGLEAEGQRYTPHITLTRPKDTPSAKLREFLARYSLFRTEPFEVEEFHLFSSFLGRSGATYRIERSYELSPYP